VLFDSVLAFGCTWVEAGTRTASPTNVTPAPAGALPLARANARIRSGSWVVAAIVLAIAYFFGSSAYAGADDTRFEIAFPASAHSQPITGRVYVMITRDPLHEPRLQVGNWADSAPFFGVDVDQLKPGDAATIDAQTLGYPLRSLKDIPAGDYYVQGLMQVYTEFHRADGHVIWAHMDQWEGQHFNRSPGNLMSEVQKIHLDPAAGFTVRLSLAKVIPPIEVPADTAWVKRIKIQSKLLSAFWGRPIYFGATILLPKGYDAHPGVSYPVVYLQGHFSLAAPFGFQTEPSAESDFQRVARENRGTETGYEFYQAWNSDDFPRVIAVTFQHPTPYFDDSYAVNSENNGPYGDAIMTELIPYIEEHFRIIREPWARLLTGGSTGGWESLSLQVHHPEFFGGTWTFFPDQIDFRRYGLLNIYEDDNAFVVRKEHTEQNQVYANHEWFTPERPFERAQDGQPERSFRDVSQLELVLASKGRSGQQVGTFDAVFGPVGDDGYPKPLWDKASGKIDHEVADYYREHGYDLSNYVETHWTEIGTQLEGKLYLAVGDMDHGFFNLAVGLLEDFLKRSQKPHYEGTFVYGRPMKGHGWHPMTQAELIKVMANHASAHAPQGEDTSAWKY
jgi:hypothetical protein